MGANPVKSRNIELFPKKLWIHNSANYQGQINNLNNAVTGTKKIRFYLNMPCVIPQNGAHDVGKTHSILMYEDGISWGIFQFQIGLPYIPIRSPFKIANYSKFRPKHECGIQVLNTTTSEYPAVSFNGLINTVGDIWVVAVTSEVPAGGVAFCTGIWPFDTADFYSTTL